MKSKISLFILTLALPGFVLAADPSGAAPKSAGTAATGQATPAKDAEIKSPKAGAKCAAHKAAKADCFICDPALRDKGRLWCKEHARYEDRCFLCHPEVKEEGRAYCGKHHLYQDECFLCRPELKKASAGGKGAGAPAGKDAAPADVPAPDKAPAPGKSPAPGKG